MIGNGEPMIGEPMEIKLKSDAKSFAIYAARPIPFAFRDQVKNDFEMMVEQGVIESVGDRHMEWCHTLHCVP